MRRDDSTGELSRAPMRLGILLFVLIVLACTAEEPSTSPLDVRTDPGDEGRVSGQVRAPAGDSEPAPVPGAVVELGRWQGGPDDFRDSQGKHSGTAPDDPRFRIIARAVVDDSGAYNLREVPRWQTLGLRVRPVPGTPYRVTYLDSLFILGQGSDRWKWFRIILEPQ